MKLGPEQNVQMPMKTVVSLIIMVSLGTMGYFQIQEKLNQDKRDNWVDIAGYARCGSICKNGK